MQKHPGDQKGFLSEQQRTILGSILDQIIPTNSNFPTTSELNLAEHIESIAELFDHTKKLLSEGLEYIEAYSIQLHSNKFVDLSEEEKVAVVKLIESLRPKFFSTLVTQTYAGYYTNSKVLKAKGILQHPPQPQGYQVDAFDKELLINVKARGNIYKDI